VKNTDLPKCIYLRLEFTIEAAYCIRSGFASLCLNSSSQ
jgi:hypothetical protein